MPDGRGARLKQPGDQCSERELEARGLITRTTGGNGARSGLRSHGLILWAAGINLAPLIGRYAELKSLWEAHCLHLQAIAECKAEIRRLRRLIREGGGAEQMELTDAILPHGRIAPINHIERLEAIRAGLEAVLADLGHELDNTPRAIKTSDRSEENGPPNIQNHNSSREYEATRREVTITPAAALVLASPDCRTMAGGTGEPGWSELVETSRQMASAIGISQRTWGHACTIMGRERASLCVLVIDRNARLRPGHRFEIRHPGKCLSGMVSRAMSEALNLNGLLRACQPSEDALSGKARSAACDPDARHAPQQSQDVQDRPLSAVVRNILVHATKGHTAEGTRARA